MASQFVRLPLTGLTNPMTTLGDMIYGGASGVPTRLGIGSEGQVLSVVSGIPGWATISGTGTVTSVGAKTDSTTDSIFANTTHNITGSPVTTAGNITFTLSVQNKNKVLAGPASGSDAAPTFRALVAADLGTGLDAQFDGIGIGEAATAATLSVASNFNFCLRRSSDISTTGTINNLDIAGNQYKNYSGAGSVTITGFAGAVDGKIFMIRNNSGNTLTLANESASSTAANRIHTGTGANVLVDDQNCAFLYYDTTVSRWVIINNVGTNVTLTDTQTLTNKTLTNPVVGTQSFGDSSTLAASTAFVQAALVPVFGSMVSYNTSAGQSIPNNADTIVNFETSEFSYGSDLTVSTGASWRCTCNSTGIYQIVYGISWNVAFSTSSATSVNIYKNGSFFRQPYSLQLSATTYDRANNVVYMSLTAGDYVNIQVQQNSGSTKQLDTGGIQTFFQMVRVH